MASPPNWKSRMDTAVASLVDARNNMVDGQLRPSKVIDRRVLDAMRTLPREAFVPQSQRPLAYADVDVPIGNGRVLLAPLSLARLIQAADLPPAGKVLVLGAGYAAAVFAAMGGAVVAVEQDPVLRDSAAAALRICGVSVTIVAGQFADGWAPDAPYDVIFVDGAVQELPDLAAQLKPAPQGRLCAVLATGGRNGAGVVAEQAGGRLAQRILFDCKANLLPQLIKAPGFRF
jgi:protein-L-isoaspartate(D-aspartate) O-methyltransferase